MASKDTSTSTASSAGQEHSPTPKAPTHVAGHHGGGEVMVHVSCDTGHISEGGSVSVRVTTSLDQHADDESFGIVNVVLERI